MISVILVLIACIVAYWLLRRVVFCVAGVACCLWCFCCLILIYLLIVLLFIVCGFNGLLVFCEILVCFVLFVHLYHLHSFALLIWVCYYGIGLFVANFAWVRLVLAGGCFDCFELFIILVVVCYCFVLVLMFVDWWVLVISCVCLCWCLLRNLLFWIIY